MVANQGPLPLFLFKHMKSKSTMPVSIQYAQYDCMASTTFQHLHTKNFKKRGKIAPMDI